MTGANQPATLYDSYGMAGQSWAAYDMQCSDMTSLIGNSVAGMVFDASKALDRVTITVYQSAAGEGILSWLTTSVDRLITSLATRSTSRSWPRWSFSARSGWPGRG